MPYRDDILALAPDHFWTWDNTHNDIGVGPSSPKPTNQAGGNTATLTGTPICEDATVSLELPSASARTECADSAQINSTSQAQRTMGGWFVCPTFTDSVTHVYKEGGGTNNITIWMFPDNFVMAQAIGTNVNPDINKQVFGDFQLVPGRVYHLLFRFEGAVDFEFFIDGVKQLNSVGTVGTSPTMPGNGADIDWGDSDTSLRMGATNNYNGVAVPGCRYNFWKTWTTLITDTQIRETLFERGVLPTVTIVADTVDNMQTALDAIANSERPDAPLAIRIEQATDTADFTLLADNIFFNESCSIDVQYVGSNTLTWVNNNGSNADIASVPNGGAVVFQTPRAVTLSGLENGTRVKVYRLSDNTELAGIESSAGDFTAFLSTAEQVTFRLASLTRRITEFDLTVPETDTTIPVSQQLDRVYENG